jgi:TusA-related sulfurtransferase
MKGFLFLIAALLICSCQSLPVIKPELSTDMKNFTCPCPFLNEKYRFVHALETRMAGNRRGAIIGVTVTDPVSRSVSCAIMTVEGIVLFEAEAEQNEINVKRALPPFDSESFAKNMIDDIKLIFFMPEGQIQGRGYLQDGSKVCRYLKESGDWVDVKENKSGNVEIGFYSSSHALKRQVLFNKIAKNIYQNIELHADDTLDYSLWMTLIDAQPIKIKKRKRK